MKDDPPIPFPLAAERGPGAHLTPEHAAPATLADVTQLLRDHLATLERIASALGGPAPLPRVLVSKAEAMTMLDCASDGAFYARLRELGIRSIGGSFRVRDLEAAAERRSLLTRRRPTFSRRSA